MREHLGALLWLALTACTSTVHEADGSGEGGGGSGEGANGSGGQAEGGSGGGPACTTPGDHPVFALGTGEDCFEPLSDGDVLPLISGPQGGYHLWLALGCSDCGATPVLSWGARDPATGQTLEGTFDSQGVVNLSGGAWPQAAGLFAGMPGVSWDPENEPPPAPGTHVILWARVDAAGHEAAVEVVIGETIAWDPCIEDPNDPNCGFG